MHPPDHPPRYKIQDAISKATHPPGSRDGCPTNPVA
jgi:hypothetical protein